MPAPVRVPLWVLFTFLSWGVRPTELTQLRDRSTQQVAGIVGDVNDAAAALSDTEDVGEEVVEEEEKSDLVSAMVVAEDSHVFTAGYNGQIVEWGCDVLEDLPYKTVAEIRRYNHSQVSPVPIRVMLRMGHVLFSGGADGRVVGFSLVSHERVLTIELGTMIEALATDGRFLYIGGYDGIVTAYDTDVDQMSRCRKYGNGTVNALTWPEGGDLLYVGGSDGAIDVWYLDSDEWTPLNSSDAKCTISTEPVAVNSTVLLDELAEETEYESENGTMITNTNKSNKSNVSGARQVGPVVTAFANVGSGRTLYSASVDGVVRSWDTGTGENVGYMTLPNMEKINAIVMTKDGHQIFSGGDNVAFRWDIQTMEVTNRTSGYWISAKVGPMFSFGADIHAMALDEEKKRLYLAGKGGEAMAFDMVSGTWLYRMWHKKINWNQQSAEELSATLGLPESLAQQSGHGAEALPRVRIQPDLAVEVNSNGAIRSSLGRLADLRRAE